MHRKFESSKENQSTREESVRNSHSYKVMKFLLRDRAINAPEDQKEHQNQVFSKDDDKEKTHLVAESPSGDSAKISPKDFVQKLDELPQNLHTNAEEIEMERIISEETRKLAFNRENEIILEISKGIIKSDNDKLERMRSFNEALESLDSKETKNSAPIEEFAKFLSEVPDYLVNHCFKDLSEKFEETRYQMKVSEKEYNESIGKIGQFEQCMQKNKIYLKYLKEYKRLKHQLTTLHKTLEIRNKLTQDESTPIHAEEN